MNKIVNKFVLAHDRYMELDRVRTQCSSPAERESIHIAILTAYLEVQFHARQIAGLRKTTGRDVPVPSSDEAVPSLPPSFR